MAHNNYRILIDALGIDRPGGGRTATLYLLEELFRIRPDWQFTVFLSHPELLFSPFAHVRQVILPVRKGIIARLLVQILTPVFAWLQGIDLVHFTKSQGGLVPGPKTVLTLFDVTTLRYPEYHSRLAVWFWRYIQPFVARHSDAVVTISNDAVKDIQQIYHIPREKIHLIYCAGQPSFQDPVTDSDFQTVNERYNLPDRYLIFIGAIAQKKNLSTLIQAIKIIKDRGTVARLVLIGPRYSQSDDREIFALIDKLGLKEQVRYIGPVEVHELTILLSRAEIFLLPSAHEGFGIPCLEAMTCGVPVIASKASAIPEIVADAGFLITDFMSPEAWANAIDQLLQDRQARTALIDKGYQRAAEFSWERSAQSLAKLYQDLIRKTSDAL